MDTSLIISSTNAGKKLQKAITNINPDKDNAVLKTFAQKVNALTTNNYVDATRVNKMSVEEEYQQGGGTSKQEGVITLDNDDPYEHYKTVTYNGDGTLYFCRSYNNSHNFETIASGQRVGMSDFETAIFCAEATDNYTAAFCFTHVED